MLVSISSALNETLSLCALCPVEAIEINPRLGGVSRHGEVRSTVVAPVRLVVADGTQMDL